MWGRGQAVVARWSAPRGVWGGGNDGPPGAAPRTDVMLGARPGAARHPGATRGHAAGGGRVAHGWTRAPRRVGAHTGSNASAPREQGAGSSLRPPAGNKETSLSPLARSNLSRSSYWVERIKSARSTREAGHLRMGKRKRKQLARKQGAASRAATKRSPRATDRSRAQSPMTSRREPRTTSSTSRTTSAQSTSCSAER